MRDDGPSRAAPHLSRRAVTAALVLTPILSRTALAREAVIDLTWADLVPKDDRAAIEALLGLGAGPHDEMSMPTSEQPVSSGVITAYDGKLVRLPGYVLPLDVSGGGVTAFILVPYVGACIHVPPPPANQLVFVTTERAYRSSGLYEAVVVTGMFGTAAMSTQLADIGYALSADRIEPYA